MLVAGEPGGVDGGRREGLLECESLLGMPRVAAVDRAQDARADAGPGVQLLDRCVGAVCQEGARVPERAVGVRAFGLAAPEAVGHVAIRRGVTELDRCGDPE